MVFVPMRVGPFWLTEPLGSGGMGSVYRGWTREALPRVAAVKVLARSDKGVASQVHALILEAETAKRIANHPCLVPHIASGYEDGEYFFGMEFAPGPRLDKHLDHHGPLSERDAVLMALYLLSAEQHIYRCGYLYRDLKPENILLGEDGRVVLLDYGLCIPLDKARSPQEDYVSGSPYYLPPERLAGEGEDACSEVYSLGMVLYYALTGNTFFDAEEIEALAQRHLSRIRVSPASRLKGFNEALVEVISRMIRAEPEERYQDFAVLARELHGLLGTLAG
jgi:serine/threonine-protein kinase